MTVRQGIFAGVFAVIAIFVLCVIFGASKTVTQGNVGVYLNFGKADSQVLLPGIHFKAPFVSEIELMPVTTARFDSGNLQLKSKDQQEINSSLIVTYHMDANKAVYLYGKTAGDPARINEVFVKPTVPGIAGQSFSHYTIEELVTMRDELQKNLKERLAKTLNEQGLILEDVNITTFGFSDIYNRSIEEKVAQEQAKLTAQLTLEKKTIDANIQVVNATAEANSAIKLADGEAQAQLLRANATAKSIKVVNDQLSSVSDKYIPYILATRWNGVTPTVSSSPGTSNIISLPTAK